MKIMFSIFRKKLQESQEKRIINHLKKRNYSIDIISETCKEPVLRLDGGLVDKILGIKEKEVVEIIETKLDYEYNQMKLKLNPYEIDYQKIKNLIYTSISKTKLLSQ